MAGRLTVFYEWDDPYGGSGVRFVAWRSGEDLEPSHVLPRLFGFASWFLPKPRQSRVEELEDRVASLEQRLLAGSSFSTLERELNAYGVDPKTYEIGYPALTSGRPAWR